jgi:tartrate-resistant acid phosphatase type 5
VPIRSFSPRLAAALLGTLLMAAACERTPPEARPPVTSTSASTTTSTPAPSTTTTTAPDPDVPIAGFVAFGDFGGGPGQRGVAQAMLRWAASHRVDALVTTGDNVYDVGSPSLFRAHLLDPYVELRAPGRPLWVTLGNHDVVAGHGPEQLAFLGLPALPYAQALPGVRLLFLDANHPDEAQAAWLERQLTEAGPQFSVAVFHQPVHSCGPHGPTPGVVARWAPVFEAHRVALVLTGHDHNYFRFLSGNGVTYVVTGGGGNGLYPIRPGCAPPELRAAARRYHFTAMEVFIDRLVLTAVGDDGTVLDRAEIPAPAH